MDYRFHFQMNFLFLEKNHLYSLPRCTNFHLYLLQADQKSKIIFTQQNNKTLFTSQPLINKDIKVSPLRLSKSMNKQPGGTFTGF